MNIKEPFKGGKWGFEIDGTLIYIRKGKKENIIMPDQLRQPHLFSDFSKYPYFDWNDFVVNWMAALDAAKITEVHLNFSQKERFGAIKERSDT